MDIILNSNLQKNGGFTQSFSADGSEMAEPKGKDGGHLLESRGVPGDGEKANRDHSSTPL